MEKHNDLDLIGCIALFVSLATAFIVFYTVFSYLSDLNNRIQTLEKIVNTQREK